MLDHMEKTGEDVGKKRKSGFAAFLTLGGRSRGLLIAFCVGLALLLLGNLPLWRSVSGTRTSADGTEDERLDRMLPEYRNALEKEIEDLCLSLDGIREAAAVVSLDGGFTYIYAVDSQTKKSGDTETRQETYVTLGSGSAAKALCLTCRPPAVTGIGVVCRGGNRQVYSELTVLLAATYDLPTHKIYITAGDPVA